jgi:hypothetical protein
VALKGADKSEVKLEGGRLYVAGGSDRPLLDVNGLGRAGLLEVMQVGRDWGAVYRTLSREAPPMGLTMQLSAGNVAVIGMNGLRAEINTTDPSGQGMVREGRLATVHGYQWFLALLMITAGASVLAYAWRMYKRKAGKPSDGGPIG